MSNLNSRFKSKIGRPFLAIKFALRKAFTKLLRTIFFRRQNNLLCISLDTERIADGTGAQIQRALSAKLIASVFHIGYVHRDFKSIQIHPLDPFQDQKSYSDYLIRLNNTFYFPSLNANLENFEIIMVRSITIWKLLKLQIRSKVFKRKLHIVIQDPYPISESFVDQFSSIGFSFNKNFEDGTLSRLVGEHDVVIHHRQGVGNMAIYPGQKISRELDLEYFFQALESILMDGLGGARENVRVLILTDAPLEKIRYAPPADQIDLWNGTPNFSSGTVLIEGNLLEEKFVQRGFRVKVLSGGDPLDAIFIMSKAKFLIAARSSLSYVAGLLNQTGTVFAAPDFWHSKPRVWRKI
jgi:hypothetical protein